MICDDLEPNCPTNDTDYCGICAGGAGDDLGCGCFNPAALEYWFDEDGAILVVHFNLSVLGAQELKAIYRYM